MVVSESLKEEVIFECRQKKERAHHLGGMEDHPKWGATLQKEESRWTWELWG